jgi:hypothetical protein
MRLTWSVLEFPNYLLVPSKTAETGRVEQGAFSFIARGPEIVGTLEGMFGRPNLCLKVFKREYRPLEKFKWSAAGARLVDCTRAQNLFARYGFAPRVYGIALVNGDRWAQVTDYVTDDGKQFDRDAARQLVMGHNVRCHGGDMNTANWVGSQMVDFQNHFLPESYAARLKNRAYKIAAWGSRSEPYQDVDGFEMDSQRNMEHRIEMMQFNKLSFKRRSVLDLGCNLGEFCREAVRRGALQVTGVDLPHIADLTFELSNWLGYWNIDFLGLHLPREHDRLDEYDIVFALSVKQVKPFPWVFGTVAPFGVFYLEGHVPQREDTYRETLEAEFGVENVEFLGATRDHGPRPLFRCWRM